MPAEITLDGLGSALDAELRSAGTRLPGTRTGDGAYRLTSRRRRGDAHRVVASTLGVLAIVGCVMAVIILAIQPTASRMQNDIASLTERLGAAESQLAAIQRLTAHTAREGSRLSRSVGLLDRHLTGLGRTVGGLQGATSSTRNETDGLRACFSALQQELGGLTLKTRSVHGRVTNVGLSETVGAPSACGAVFSGG